MKVLHRERCSESRLTKIHADIIAVFRLNNSMSCNKGLGVTIHPIHGIPTDLTNKSHNQWLSNTMFLSHHI